MRVRVEVCATSPAEAFAADALGCDAVELCTWPECGGVTPSLGMVMAVLERARCRVRVLIRPIPGGFHHDDTAMRAALLDVERFASCDALHGLVVGALDADDLPHARFMEEVRMAASDKELTFHRAIDLARPVPEVIARCVDGGMQRILTSGGAVTAMEGTDRIRTMLEEAAGRLTIAAGAGVGPTNVVRLVESTGVEEVHFSARSHVTDGATGPMDLGGATIPDVAKIEGVLNALIKAGLR